RTAAWGLMAGLLATSRPAAAIDKITCLGAKSNFLACATLAQTEQLPLLSCLRADSGYADCRRLEGPGWHERCLPAKRQYGYCRETFKELTYFDCVNADSGFKDCVTKWEHDPLTCLGVKGGYDTCRAESPTHSHQQCVTADAGYA